MRTLHSPKRKDHNEPAILSLRDSLGSDLAKWYQGTEKIGLLGDTLSTIASKNRSSFLSKEWYNVIYHNAMLMIFRPSPLISDTHNPSTLQKLFRSSKESILLYASLHRSRKINYSWITLHSVFMAGLTYLYALSRHLRERRKASPRGSILGADPTAIEIVNDTRSCSNVLVAVSERWNSLRNCHEVFDRLSDAVLSDAIKLQSSIPMSRARTPNVPAGSPPGIRATTLTSSDLQSNFNSTDSAAYQSSWTGTEYAPSTIGGFHTGTSPLAIDSEFRNCYDDLQNIYSAPFAGDPVMELSQDWLGYIDGFDLMAQPMSMEEFSGTHG